MFSKRFCVSRVATNRPSCPPLSSLMFVDSQADAPSWVTQIYLFNWDLDQSTHWIMIQGLSQYSVPFL